MEEGSEVFDELYVKVIDEDAQSKKDKYENDLKKEIKKLQRLRDHIKTWLSSSEIKDKEELLTSRKLIESKMELFKECEKETKTKTYSKEGLARAKKLDPAEQAKKVAIDWITGILVVFNDAMEEVNNFFSIFLSNNQPPST
mgnify:FL=1